MAPAHPRFWQREKRTTWQCQRDPLSPPRMWAGSQATHERRGAIAVGCSMATDVSHLFPGPFLMLPVVHASVARNSRLPLPMMTGFHIIYRQGSSQVGVRMEDETHYCGETDIPMDRNNTPLPKAALAACDAESGPDGPSSTPRRSHNRGRVPCGGVCIQPQGGETSLPLSP
jgi:hypothetical protein